MPHVEANGQNLYYEIHGDGAETLLAIQGLGTDSRGWTLQIPDWSREYRVVVFDNRDVGRSSYAEGEYETSDMARDAIALADALELERFHLVGMSMGSAISQHVALQIPDRLLSLTLVVTYGGSGRYSQVAGRVRGEATAKLPLEDRIDQFMVQCFSERFFEDEETVERLRRGLLENEFAQDPGAFARQSRASGRHELRARLGDISVPTHVIGAERDVLVPVWKAREVAELIPGARLTVVEGAPHGLNWERPAEFNPLVLDFLATAATRS